MASTALTHTSIGMISTEKVAVNWREIGMCKGTDPDVFFPLDEEDPADEAKSVCSQCPVSDGCLEHAIKAREPAGVWGGLTTRERRRLVRRRTRRDNR